MEIGKGNYFIQTTNYFGFKGGCIRLGKIAFTWRKYDRLYFSERYGYENFWVLFGYLFKVKKF
jgi:hypothetical protein